MTYAGRLVRATIRNADDHDLLGEAAKVAFFLFLSLFPVVLVLLSLTGLIGGEQAFDRIARAVQTMIPEYGWQFVRELIREVTDGERPGVLSFGIVFALWAASSGIAALMTGLNSMYGIDEARRWWKRRLIAVAVLVAGAILTVLGAAVFIPAETWLADRDLLPLWRYARWPVSYLLLTGTAWIAYLYLPARAQPASIGKTLAGAALASALWLLAALLFRIYVADIARYGRVYGAVGAVIVLMMWFYLAALAVLLGGEVAATLESRRMMRQHRDAS
jgi:membrane protein